MSASVSTPGMAAESHENHEMMKAGIVVIEKKKILYYYVGMYPDSDGGTAETVESSVVKHSIA